MAIEHFDGVVVGAAGVHMHGGPIKNRHGQQANAIADAEHAAGANPTAEEFDALVDKFNELLTAVRSKTGVGIVASE